MTLGTYAHFQPAQDRAAAELLGHPLRRPAEGHAVRHRRVRHTGMTASSDTVSEVTRMGEQAPRGTLYVVVCAAPPAAHVQDLVKLAQAAGWEVAVTATPEALAFIDASLLEAITGFSPVRHCGGSRMSLRACPRPTPSWSPPATFNTINRWVAGITNTVAVGTLCESLGLDDRRRPLNVNLPLALTPDLPDESRQLREWGAGAVRGVRPSRGSHAFVGGDPRGGRPGAGGHRGGHPEELLGQAPWRGSTEGRRDPARGVHVGRRAHRHLPPPHVACPNSPWPT